MLRCINSSELERAGGGWVPVAATNGGEAANRANGGEGSGPPNSEGGELHRRQRRWSRVNGSEGGIMAGRCSGSDNGGGGRTVATALKVAQEVVGPGWPCRGRLGGHYKFVEAQEASEPVSLGRTLVLFLPRPQNRARKSLCNLRTLKPRRVNFTRQKQFLTFLLRGTVYV
jgi:hypothetical protein